MQILRQHSLAPFRKPQKISDGNFSQTRKISTYSPVPGFYTRPENTPVPVSNYSPLPSAVRVDQALPNNWAIQTDSPGIDADGGLDLQETCLTKHQCFLLATLLTLQSKYGLGPGARLWYFEKNF